MTMATTLQRFLEERRVPYELVDHPRTFTSAETAEAAHVGGDRLAKAVVVEDEEHFMVALIPSTHRLHLTALREQEPAHEQCGLATEQQVERLFGDCEPGAVPAPAQAYGLDVLVDENLLGLEDVYFEAGDHRHLVHVAGEDFRRLMDDARRGRFGERA